MPSQVAPQPAEPVELQERKPVPDAWKFIILERQHWTCAACEEVDLARPSLTDFDHIIALALGGLHEVGNLQALCIPCHKIKTAADRKAIAKAKRREMKANGTFPPARQKLRGRGFQKREPTERR